MPRLPYTIESALRRARREMTPARAVAAGALVVVLVVGGWLITRESKPARVGDVEAPDRAAGVLRLATFDLDGLYDARDDAGDADDTPTPEPRLREIADLILRTDADVLALQGVESREALAWFRDAYIGPAGYTHVASIDVGNAKGLECAVLSRLPIRNPRVLADTPLQGTHPPQANGKPNPFAGQPLRFNRAPLSVEVETSAADRLVIIVVDAKGGDAFEYWRGAESAAILRHASEITRPAAILGSFHAEPGDPSVDVLLHAGFIDAFASAHDSPRLQTETSGDRTTLVLVNDRLAPALQPRGGFVLAPAASSAGPRDDSIHLPLVVELDPTRL